MTNLGGLELLLTVIYAENSREDRKMAWKDLVDIISTATDVGWIALGNFNEVRVPENRLATGIYSHGGLKEFI